VFFCGPTSVFSCGGLCFSVFFRGSYSSVFFRVFLWPVFFLCFSVFVCGLYSFCVFPCLSVAQLLFAPPTICAAPTELPFRISFINAIVSCSSATLRRSASKSVSRAAALCGSA
jgi:hypothetical protein